MATLIVNTFGLWPIDLKAEGVLSGGLRIKTTDDVLDRVAELVNDSVTGERRGFWLAGQLDVEVKDELTHPNPRNGHQRLWIPASAAVHLIYDRPLHPSPDRLEDRADTVYL
ncbi:hypothetical protein [Devriesea agamarum]|uniref:hypothetical protein n=1 Tax=Devriesea agamarum TaxID=472569 RepID=UPI00071D84D5|nr:hypothetical protein [Devriesea agamarum]